MIISCHQPNLIPNMSFFYKMAHSELFIILKEVDFCKNNFQNRYLLNKSEKWVTKSVRSAGNSIKEKQYADGSNLLKVNMAWIQAIRMTLGITTKWAFDYPTTLTKTERLIDIIQYYKGTTYLTNESAKDKYLDEDLMRSSGIEIKYLDMPKHLNMHIFEAFEQFGIDGVIKQLGIKNREYSNIG